MAYVLSAYYAELYESFLAYEQKRVSREGYRSVKSLAYLVLKWFEDEELLLEEATVQDIVRYKEYLSERVLPNGRQISNGCINNYLGFTRKLFQYLVAVERRLSNPAEGLKNTRRPEHVSRNYLDELEMNRLLEKLARFDEPKEVQECRRRYRVHVLAEFLYATGLRKSELEHVKRKHIDLKGRMVYVAAGKGGKSRSAFLTAYATEVMALYLEKGYLAALNNYERERPEYIFGQSLGTVMSRELTKLCGELDLPVITPHAFRHSLGTHLLRAGCDMRYIQVILGHDAINSTQVYTHVNKEDLRKNLDIYHPRQWRVAL
jgi:site-specific recombinase XerD